jgi:integrase
MAAADPAVRSRTWQLAMDEMAKCKQGVTKERWVRGVAEKPFDLIRNRPLVETRAEQFFEILTTGTVSSNIFLRRIHNFALDMGWLLAAIIPRRKWPAIHFKAKRAITLEEHQKIIAGEANSELRDYYELLWFLGGSQSDTASLCAENLDWPNRTISYARMKTGSQVVIRFGDSVARILDRRPKKGNLFPRVATWRETDRAKAFMRRCKLVGVSGVSLHCYRYAWAERARSAGYPERFAQEALGHKSQAVHRAYAKNGQVRIPALEDYERNIPANNVIELPLHSPSHAMAHAAGSTR